MARIVIGANMVRYPLGGMNQWIMAWLVGFQKLGHSVYFVEKSEWWPNSCYDPSRGVMTDDCSYGVAVVSALLQRFGLRDNWCFVDATGRYHGLPRERVGAILKSADLFVDLEWSEWLAEAADACVRVFVDGEPGWFQIKMENGRQAGEEVPRYDYYYTIGSNIGTDRSTAPTAGKEWRHLFAPVLVELFPYHPVNQDAPFTTVMNWRSHKQVEFNGITYGQKDVEFSKFIALPGLTTTPLEIAVSGRDVPKEQLRDAGWRLRNADKVAVTIDSYKEYILASKGEFGVAKNVFVATNCGWFSDRAGYYMASGRPVVAQDTGFGDHLPCGQGLFAVRTVEEAAAAIEEINGNYERHARWAREIAVEYLDAQKVLRKFLRELGI
jgi:hypothetical protein